MPLPLGIRLTLCTQMAAAALAQLALHRDSDAQQFILGLQRPAASELSAPRVAEISGTTAARLEQAEALAADENWSDALEALRDLASEYDDRVVPIGNNRFVGLKTYCDMQIAQWPAAGLAAYRRRVDPQAERLFRAGVAARDESALRQVVDETFCSSWTDDALLALGELALERADFAAARRAWEQISPFTRDPTGRPLWLALGDLDLDVHWPEIEKRWNHRSTSADWLAYPDTDLDLADVRARLILASIRAGELDRAAIELDVFRRFHPDAVGRLAGQEERYVAALERVMASSSDWPPIPRATNWPTFAGALSRTFVAEKLSPTIERLWTKSVASLTLNEPRPPHSRITGEAPGFGPSALGSDQSLPSIFPVIRGNLLLFGNSERLCGWNLATGDAAITRDGVIYRTEKAADEVPGAGMHLGRTPWQTSPRYTLTVTDDVLYARIGRKETHQQPVGSGPIAERLVGLDLRRDGLLTLQLKPDDPSWAFEGAPIVDGRRLFIAMRRSDVTPQAYVASFDTATGKELWRTSIGGGDTLVDDGGSEMTSNLLTFAGGRLYFNANLGLVAALDAEDGQIEWLYRCPRARRLSSLGSPQNDFLERHPAPCVYSNGLIIVAPSDTPSIFALDAETGHPLWSNDQLPEALHLLGVVDDNLVVVGRQLCILSARTGRIRRVWPESKHAGIRGMGRGVIAGDEVFWPTRKEILVFDVASGAQSRPPLDLSPVGGNGANLIAAEGYLVATGPEALMAFGSLRARAAPIEPSGSSTAAEPIADRN